MHLVILVLVTQLSNLLKAVTTADSLAGDPSVLSLVNCAQVIFTLIRFQ